MEDTVSRKIKRVYVDNSVVSGMFDDHLPERVEQTGRFWQAVIDGTIRIIVSDVLEGEAKRAPQNVRDFFGGLPESQIEQIESTTESNRLAAEYVGAKVISKNHLNDCKHVAIATIAHADAVVSWNCEDMVNPHRIPQYNEVNVTEGYPEIKIITPHDFMEAHHDKT
jgi:predicted nucleic acid-binding protein